MVELISLDQIESIFIAKCNVKHSTGGPTMALVGFIHPLAMRVFEQLGENLTKDQLLYLSEKIIIEKEKGIGFFRGVADKIFYGHIFNQQGQLEGWHSPGKYANRFFCLVRFYDEDSKKFIFKTFSQNELVLS